MSPQDIQKATQNDMHLYELKEYIIKGLPYHTSVIGQDMRPYWTFSYNIDIID